MATIQPLAMSSTKDDLLKHLNLPLETYALMAKETDRVYLWLTAEKLHLKSNCKRKPPYDWSDIQEKFKDEALLAISTRGDEYTDYYWRLAPPEDNWIARWFLYHKFRYRDGRNRPNTKSSDDRRPHHDSKHGKHHKSKAHQASEYTGGDDYYEESGTVAESSGTYYSTDARSLSSGTYYSSTSAQQSADTGSTARSTAQSSGSYYDPVRDV